MKSLNLKKVAAVGAGVALVAASVFAAPALSDVYDSTEKTALVNGIVVDAAGGMDDVAAENLAGAIALATTYEEEVPNMVCPSAGAEGYDGDVKKYDSSALGSETNQNVSYTSVGNLMYDSSLDYKIGGTSYESSLKETVGFAVTPSFDTSNDVQRLNAEVNSSDLNYYIDLGVGIDFNKDSTFTSTTWTDTGSSDDVELSVLGTEYQVHKVILNSGASDISQIELFEKNALKTYSIGDKIENLEGKDGETYYVSIEAVTTGSEVVMTLYNAETGEQVADYVNEKIGASSKFAEDMLEGMVEVTSVDNWGTFDEPDWHVEIAVGDEAITLYQGKGFPYDSTMTSTSDYDWQVTDLTTTTTGTTLVLTGITLKNTSKYDFWNDEGLEPGEFLEFPGKTAALKFIGLQLPEFDATNPKDVYNIEFGVEVDDGVGHGITYFDTSEVYHEVPFYYEFALDTADSSDSYLTQSTVYKVDSFEFDGITYSLKIDYQNDTNVLVGLFDGTYAASTTSTATEAATASATLNLDENANGTHMYDVDGMITLPNSEGSDIEYAIGFDASERRMWLLLDAQTGIATKTGNITFIGTDLNSEDSAATFATLPDGNASFYAPADNGNFETLVNTGHVDTNSWYEPQQTFSDSRASLARFTVDLATSGQDDNINIVMDTETSAAVSYGASSNASNSIPGPGYQLKDTYSTALYLKKGVTNGLETLYDNYGAKAMIDEDHIITLSIPDEQAKVELQVVGYSGATTEECAEEDKIEDGTVMADVIGADLGLVDDTAAVGSEENYIVVGGQMVNEFFAANYETLVEAGFPLESADDSVLTVLEGNVYVAGWTKEDTSALVDDFITMLEDNE